MIEIIRRKKKASSEKTQIQYGHPQISFNSDGHLVVRLINGEDDTLIVFDNKSSNELIMFCQNYISQRASIEWVIPKEMRG